jgi:predicted nucleic acid-binding protein
MIVLDASVFAKLLVDEADRPKARALIERSLVQGEGMIAPSLLVYETLSIALRHGVPFGEAMDLLGKLRLSGLSIEEPTVGELIRAEKIATAGHAKSGYPALEDSIYHAMAIERGGTFVTADKRHFAKARQFGNLVLLADYRTG